MKTAVINSESFVVNLLAGIIPEDQDAAFMAHFARAYGVVSFIRITDETTVVWIGGSYDAISGTFTPPPSPEPEAVIEEIIPE